MDTGEESGGKKPKQSALKSALAPIRTTYEDLKDLMLVLWVMLCMTLKISNKTKRHLKKAVDEAIKNIDAEDLDDLDKAIYGLKMTEAALMRKKAEMILAAKGYPEASAAHRLKGEVVRIDAELSTGKAPEGSGAEASVCPELPLRPEAKLRVEAAARAGDEGRLREILAGCGYEYEFFEINGLIGVIKCREGVCTVLLEPVETEGEAGWKEDGAEDETPERDAAASEEEGWLRAFVDNRPVRVRIDAGETTLRLGEKEAALIARSFATRHYARVRKALKRMGYSYVRHEKSEDGSRGTIYCHEGTIALELKRPCEAPAREAKKKKER